jgi:hypothetical protein
VTFTIYLSPFFATDPVNYKKGVIGGDLKKAGIGMLEANLGLFM